LGLISITINPYIIPGWDAFFFQDNSTIKTLFLIFFSYLTLFLHEMAHLIAARAVGVSCRMGISNRMWYLVAETDMTGVWRIPRNQRYLPYFAGAILDATLASFVILSLFVHNQRWLALHPLVFELARAMLLIYLTRLVWQCYLFVRTDLYFVISNFFRCKNLMKDTEVYLLNQVARIIPSIKRVDQSHIPVAERQFIRVYAVLWLVGRSVAISYLIFITIPLTWHYLFQAYKVLSAGYAANPSAFLDTLLMIFLIFIPEVIGFWLWVRSFRFNKWR
jgi:hypothetical protein